MGDDHDRLWYVADRICLGDPEHHAALVAVGPDGDQRWMLAEHDHVCQDCPLPPPPEHERLGRLPAHIRARVNQCRAETVYRRQCSRPVPPGERYCHQHREWLPRGEVDR